MLIKVFSGDRPENRPGFTLVEVILIAVILSVITAFAVPQFGKSYLNLLIQAQADNVAALMRYAQARAVSQNRVIRLVFEQDRKAYSLQQFVFSRDGDYADASFENVPGRWGRPFRVPEEIDLETGGDQVEFYPDGQIQKNRIFVCGHNKCLTVSTSEQRGQVLVFNGRVE